MAALKADGHTALEGRAISQAGTPTGTDTPALCRRSPKGQDKLQFGETGWVGPSALCAPSSPQGPCVKAPEHESWARVCPMYKSQKKGCSWSPPGLHVRPQDYRGPLNWFPDRCCRMDGLELAASPSFRQTTLHISRTMAFSFSLKSSSQLAPSCRSRFS